MQIVLLKSSYSKPTSGEKVIHFRKDIIFVFLLSVLVVSACTTSEITPTITSIVFNTPSPISIPTNTPTSTPTNTSTTTLIPTTTPTSTLTPTATPDPRSIAPEGVRIIYEDRERSLWAWTAEEGNNKLFFPGKGNVYPLIISDDGEWIAFGFNEDINTRDSDVQLMAVRFDGSERKTLITEKELTNLVFAQQEFYEDVNAIWIWKIQFIPNTHSLLFTTLPERGYGLNGNYDLWLLDVETGELRNILPVGEGGIFSISPNGQEVALIKPDSISLIKSDGSNLRKNVFVFQHINTASEWWYHPSPIWATDSSSFHFYLPPQDSYTEEELEPGRIYQLRLDTQTTQKIYEINTGQSMGVKTSPDLSFIAYFLYVGNPNDFVYSIHLQSLDGQKTLDLAEGKSINLSSWSPGSSYFAYTDYPQSKVYIVDKNGKQMSFNCFNNYFRWINDNCYLFLSKDTNTELLSLNIGCTGLDNTVIHTFKTGTDTPGNFFGIIPSEKY